MVYDWTVYSGNDNTPSLSLLISERTQQLLLAIIQDIQPRYKWLQQDNDATWDEIDEQIADTITEVLEIIPPVTDTPVGSIVFFIALASNIPDKWQIAAGQILSGDDYPDLYDIIPTEFRNGDGTFDVPDLRSKFLYGAGVDENVGDIGGEANVTLTLAQIPSHSHTIAKGAAVASQNSRATQANNTGLADQNTGTAGGGESHNNLPPYMRGFWIIKVLP